jgi:hypothetical protein
MAEFPELPGPLTLTTLWSVIRTDVPRHIDRGRRTLVPRSSTAHENLDRAAPGMV